MAHFYGSVSGKAKTTTSRLGTKKSGIVVDVASWSGSCHVELTHDEKTGEDILAVWLRQWRSVGQWPPVLVYYGPVDRFEPDPQCRASQKNERQWSKINVDRS